MPTHPKLGMNGIMEHLVQRNQPVGIAPGSDLIIVYYFPAVAHLLLAVMSPYGSSNVGIVICTCARDL